MTTSTRQPRSGTKGRSFTFYPDNYIALVGGNLSTREQGAYWMICCLIMSNGGPIEEEHSRVGHLLRMRHRDAARLIDGLVQGHGLLVRADGKISLPPRG